MSRIPIPRAGRAVAALVVILSLTPASVAQTGDRDRFCDASASIEQVDVRGLAAVYCTDSEIASGLFGAAHATSYPVFYGAVPAAWAGAWAFRDETDFTDVYRLTLTQVATYGLTVGMKRIAGRPRPFVTLPLDARSGRSAEALGRFESFPSGHASVSVALATSWSLSHPDWYIVAPSAIWAGAVSVSRLYLGVHYPSDVVVGALLGATVATGVHLLRDLLTPAALRPNRAGATPAPVTLTVRF